MRILSKINWNIVAAVVAFFAGVCIALTTVLVLWVGPAIAKLLLLVR